MTTVMSHQPTGAAVSKSKSYRLLATRQWDVISPVPLNTLKATLTPKPLLKLHHRRARRIILETYLITFRDASSSSTNRNSSSSYEQTFVKILSRQRKLFPVSSSASTTSSTTNRSRLSSTDKSSILSHVTFIHPNRKSPQKVTSPIIKNTIIPSSNRLNHHYPLSPSGLSTHSEISDLYDQDDDDDDHHDHENPAAAAADDDDDNHTFRYTEDHHQHNHQFHQYHQQTMNYDGWKEKYIFDLDDFLLLGQEKEICIVTTTATMSHLNTMKEKDSTQRELIFPTEQEASQFMSYVKHRIMVEHKMKDSRFMNMIGQSIQNVHQRIDYIIDIVGAVGLHTKGFIKGNPFVVVQLDDVIIHQTDYIENSVDPIWTIRSKSLFLLSITIKELLIYHDKLDLFVYDYDFGDSHRILGQAIVPTTDIFLSNGQRKEYALRQVPLDSNLKGSIAIRCRHATDNDREILKNTYHPSVYLTHSKGGSTLDENEDENQKDTASIGIADSIAPLVSIIEKKERIVMNDGLKVIQYKTRPGPNPDDKMDTEWLTNDDIQRFIYKPSTTWKDMGSGTLGTVYLEVLGCDSLPSREKNGLLGNARDTFIQIVYGDSRSQTDVIDSCLSPRWLPWSSRAFTLHMKEQCAVIFLAVFDFDLKQNHTFIGRVSIPLARFHPNTEYLLDYQIHRNSTLYNRTSFGVLKIRLRLEIDHPRKYLFSSIYLTPPLILNVPDRKQFRSILLTCYGDDWDQREYNLNGISKAVDELRYHFTHISYAYEALRDVMLWRKNASISFRSKEFLFPLRSLQLFILSLIILRYPRMLPSCFTGCLLLFSFTMMQTRCSQQNPWMRCPSIYDMIRSCLFDENMSPATIALDLSYEINEDKPPEFSKSVVDVNSAHGTTAGVQSNYGKVKSPSKIDLALDLFKPNLFSLQKQLTDTIEWIRIIKRILTWEEPALSFCLSMIFLILTLLLLLVPWMTVLRSLSTVFVWTFLSPFMKLIDIIIFQENNPIDEKNSMTSFKPYVRALVLKYNLRSRIKNENEQKTKDMKRSLFGSYSIRIPRLCVDFFSDIPLPTSMATPYNTDSVYLADLCLKETGLDKIRDHGQKLVASLIPQLEKAFDYVTPIGQIARQQYLLTLNDPAASLSSDSIFLAVLKLLSILILSAISTLLAVPILKLFIERSTRTVCKMLIHSN